MALKNPILKILGLAPRSVSDSCSVMSDSTLPAPQHPSNYCAWRQRQALALVLALGLQLMQLNRVSGEDHVDYRYEAYREDDQRISIDTHSMLFEVAPKRWLNIKGEMIFDAISGASPTGSPPPNQLIFLDPSSWGGVINGDTNSTKVPVTKMTEKRYAGDLAATFSMGRHRFTPQLSYSQENDYISHGFAFNYAVDFNEKNTTLNLGWSATWDRIFIDKDTPRETKRSKDSDDFLIGINQLISPKTVATLNFTYGNARGYLDDQYKKVFFLNYPQNVLDVNDAAGDFEHRPSRRDHYTTYASLTQYVTPLNASVEGSYRFFNDSYGVNAHTVGLAWYQKLGSRLVIAPMVRYHRQSAADFYAPVFPNYLHKPRYCSADYRLSELDTITGGLTVSVKAMDWLSFDFGYKRYVMNGLDKVTSQSAYPSANIFTIGARVWF